MDACPCSGLDYVRHFQRAQGGQIANLGNNIVDKIAANAETVGYDGERSLISGRAPSLCRLGGTQILR